MGKKVMNLLVVFLLIFLDVVSGDTPLRKHLYKHSLAPPYTYETGNGEKREKILFHTTSGDFISSEDYLRLVPGIQSMKGGIWGSSPLNIESWQVVAVFTITGRGRLGGDGMAFWYTKTPLALGNAYGGDSIFDGLMIGVDTYDNDGKRNNPYIYGILNDGSSTFNPDDDGSRLSFNGCVSDLRNKDVKVHLRISYRREIGQLTVEVDNSGVGEAYKLCFQDNDIELPMGYYFGITAATGGLADDHDLYSLDFYQLNPPQKQVPDNREAPIEIDQKQFDKIREQVQQIRAKNEIPFEIDENYKQLLGKAIGKDIILEKLSSLLEGHSEIKNLVEQAISKNPQQQQYQQIDPKINELTQKLNELNRDLSSKVSTLEQILKQPKEVANNDRIDSQLRQIQEKLDQLERQGRMNQGSQETYQKPVKYSNSSNSSSDSETLMIVVIILLVVIGICVGAYFFFNRKSNPKKFI